MCASTLGCDCFRSERFRFDPEVDESRTSDLRLVEKFTDNDRADDLLRQLSRIFSALLGQHHRSICLVVAEPRVRCWCDFAGLSEIGAAQSCGDCALNERLERFHCYFATGARSRKTRRIDSASGAFPSSSRTLRSFRNFAIEASVRRCV